MRYKLFIPSGLALGMLFSLAALAQTTSQSGSSADYDPYQRSGDVFYMNRMGQAGWERGREIWYMKCWICHNEYTIKANNPQVAPVAPTLKELYKRPVLLSGKPVNDDTVKDQIREGSRQMPAYKYVLTDKDLEDLVDYLRDHCCWDEQNPPPNPRFRKP